MRRAEAGGVPEEDVGVVASIDLVLAKFAIGVVAI